MCLLSLSLAELFGGISLIADFEQANDLLCDIEFNDVLDPCDIQKSWIQLKATFLDVMEQCIPRSALPQRHNLPWLTKDIIQLIRRQKCYFKNARNSGYCADLLKFKRLRNKVVAKLRTAKFIFSYYFQKTFGISKIFEL